MNEIEIDVILPFHRIDEYLRRAIESVNKSVGVQTNLILIDDRPIYEETNLRSTLKTGGIGYASAINATLPYLQSQFCALMNSDDLIHPQRFINQIIALQNSGKKISVTRMRKFRDSGVPIFMLGGNPRFDRFKKEAQLITSFYANASWLMDTNYWSSVGGIEDFGNGSDWACGVKMFNDTDPFVHPKVLYFYRSHGTQLTKDNRELNPQLARTWGELNLSLGLPELSPLVGINLVLPGHSAGIEIDLEQILIWTKEFRLRFPELEKLLALKIIALLHYSDKIGQLKLFPFTLQFLPQLLSKFAFNRIVGS